MAAFDVVVLGVGAMGSAACYHLAKQGARVLGIEQFGVPHENGSHAGQSRIIRKAYFEHPDYVPLLERAYQNWKQLEAEVGTQLYFPTGLLYAGAPEGTLIKGVKESAKQYHIPISEITRAESNQRFPAFTIPEEFQVLFEPEAGLLIPERCILAFTEQAVQAGATIRTQEKILSWKQEGSTITVQTDQDRYSCNKLVVTTGAWTSQVVPALQPHLVVTRQLLAWSIPRSWHAYTVGNFPCWLIDDAQQPGMYYGFPILPAAHVGGPIGLKAAYHYPGQPTDANHVDRTITQAESDHLLRSVKQYLPTGFESIHTSKTCLYTNTPDENFIIDFLPGNQQVVVAAGFSGHGFKFASVVGEVLCDLALRGNTRLPIGFLHAGRFNP